MNFRSAFVLLNALSVASGFSVTRTAAAVLGPGSSSSCFCGACIKKLYQLEIELYFVAAVELQFCSVLLPLVVQ
ncbi:hypothetical protein ACHAXN_010958 [Cyclotella atomus]